MLAAIPSGAPMAQQSPQRGARAGCRLLWALCTLANQAAVKNARLAVYRVK
jgi:hypothetical protein